ncbi:hypothetical protein [Streptomyces sp. NPDC056543]|uniref:hypothetical protein n=1 Tax=unclassified Streptomyces TaxID=2593676 RepID=UPI0036BAEB64
MRVRMKATLSGTRDGEAWPKRGGTVNLPDDEAQHLIKAGVAEETDEPGEDNVAASEKTEETGEDSGPVEETATPPGEPEKAVPARRRGQAKKPGDE